MTMTKADPTPVSPRLIPVALAAILVCGTWAAAQSAPDKRTEKQPIPSLEQLLARALAGHPQIVAARSKVRLAEAELKLTRFQVAREQIALWNDWSKQTKVFEIANSLFQQQAGPAAPAIEAQAKVAALEAEIRQVLADSTVDSSTKLAPASRPPVLRIPEGPIAEQIRTALAKPVMADFVEEPVTGVVDYLKEELGIEIQIDKRRLEDLNIGPDEPVTITISPAPFVAVIQAIEDLYPEFRFVVREYGILLTTVDLESISAIDFWFETAAESENVQPKR